MYKQHANSAAHSISAHISPLAVRVQFRILRPRHSQLRISRSGCQEHEAGSRAPSIDQGSVSDSLCQRPAKPRARLSTMRQIIDSRAVRPVITMAVPGHRQNRPCRQLQRTDVVHVILRHVRRSFFADLPARCDFQQLECQAIICPCLLPGAACKIPWL